jgi:hypothetical protein
MRFKNAVKVITAVVEVILTIVLLIVFTAFALKPTEISLFTDALILVMIMVQLYIVNVMIDVYENIGGRKK